MWLKPRLPGIACFLSLLLLCLPSLGEDASMFRGNPQHSGVYDAAGLAKFKEMKWKSHTRGMLIGSPVVMEGRIYFGSTDGNLYSVDGEKGALRCKFDAKSRIPSTPAVAEGTVYFTAFDGSFYALDASTGAFKWKFQMGVERRFAGQHLHGVQPASETMPDPFDCYLSSPVVWQGAVYFGSGDGNVYSPNATSGFSHWYLYSSPAIAGSLLYF